MRHLPRKRFGQHFLADGSVIDSIISAIAPRPGDRMVEIGPGLGAITKPLVRALAPCRLRVIELDRDLAARLRQADEVDVIEADVLNVDFAVLAAADPPSDPVGASRTGLRVVGNLPYNISTPILFHLLSHREAVLDQHFMLQLEVVQRMVAGPDDGEYGRLSVMLQAYYDMEMVLEVPPDAFDPPPKVDSAVVRMRPLAQTMVPDAARAVFSELVAAAFSQRRKLLRHSLGAWLAGRGLQTGFDLQRRAQEVPVREYAELAAEVAKALAGGVPAAQGQTRFSA
jgi:16S rRNA (adenine1518-N6/adenine1519-N6)-dimethyltransferase